MPACIEPITATLAARSLGATSAGGCGPITIDTLDPAHLVHVFEDDIPRGGSLALPACPERDLNPQALTGSAV